MKSHPLTINTNLFKQININQMFDKIQIILMMKMSISNKRIWRLNNNKIWREKNPTARPNMDSNKLATMRRTLDFFL